MRDIHRNPMLYYVLIPVCVAAWPLLVWAVYLPKAEQQWDRDQESYAEAINYMLEIHHKDPDRLKAAEGARDVGKFTYPEAVNRAANLCRIPSSGVGQSTGNTVGTGKNRTRQARVNLTDISIVQGAKFLDTILSEWVHLSCERVKLSKKKGMPDQWDMDLTFKYDY